MKLHTARAIGALSRRLWQAARVVAGRRPAEVRFDPDDHARADLLAVVAADAVLGGLLPDLTDGPASDHANAVVRREVYRAIREYAGQGELFARHAVPPDDAPGAPEEIPF